MEQPDSPTDKAFNIVIRTVDGSSPKPFSRSAETGTTPTALTITAALASASSFRAVPSRRPSEAANPLLVVATARKPSETRSLAEPASQALGISSGSGPSWSARKRSACSIRSTGGASCDAVLMRPSLGAGVRSRPPGAGGGLVEAGRQRRHVGGVRQALRVLVVQQVVQLPGVVGEVVVLLPLDGGVVVLLVELDVLPLLRPQRQPGRDPPVADVALRRRPQDRAELQQLLRPGRPAGQERQPVQRVVQLRRRVAGGVEVGRQV